MDHAALNGSERWSHAQGVTPVLYFVNSVQVIEDLRRRCELLVDDEDSANDDLGSVMVRTFVPTPKAAPQTPSSRQLPRRKQLTHD